MPTQVVFDQFSAGICIGGRPAELWAPCFNPTARVVEVWVPSEAGKDYSICWRRRGDTGCDLGGVVTIDGCQVGGTSRVVPRWSAEWNEYSGQQTSWMTERPFKFNEIQTTGEISNLLNIPLPVSNTVFVKMTKGSPFTNNSRPDQEKSFSRYTASQSSVERTLLSSPDVLLLPQA